MASSARIDELRKKFDENPRRYFAPLANEYRKAGDFAQAIAICRQHLTDQPGHMSGHIVFGQALFENKDFAESRTIFEAALALDPENLIALRHLGDIARDDGDYTSARTWYQRVLDADPRNEDIAAQMALVSEAEATAATAAAAAAAAPPPAKPKSAIPLAATIVVSAVKRESAMAEARTLEITAVPRPSQLVESGSVAADMPPVAAEPAPAPVPERLEDVAPPRLSLMGLELESMAGVEETPEVGSAAAIQPGMGFESGRFDAEGDLEANPLAGLSGVAQNEENTAAGLVAPEPVDAGFELGAGYQPEASPADAESLLELPSELVVPSHTTPPLLDLGLPPQPKLEKTGLWDTPDDEAASAAEHAELEIEPSFAPQPVAAAAPAAVPQLEAIELTEREPSAAPTASGAFVTETMAELYVTQGFTDQAIEVYRQLVAERPADGPLRSRLSELQASLARAEPVSHEVLAPATMEAAALAELTDTLPSGPTVREFFGALARWQPAKGNGAQAAEVLPHLQATPALADEATVEAPLDAPQEAPLEAAAGAYDLGVFAGAVISDADEHAARRMAGLYPESPVAGNGGAHAAAAETAAPTVVDVADPLPGNPARPAAAELSLDQVFTEPAPPGAPSRPSRRSSASFSFDQFFSQAPGGTPPRAATPSAPLTPVAPAPQTPEEIEQFQSWLGGLKKQ